jgi:predicted aspartyl protease
MKERKKSKYLTYSAALLGGLSWFTSAQTLAASIVKFKLLRGYMIVIPVTVNGAGPYEFLLDTGSNTTLINAEFARALRLRPIDRVELMTVAGSQVVPRARLESVAIGAKSAADVEVVFSDLREARAISPEICGVLGQNFLSRFNYLINYREGRIEFEDGGELEKSMSENFRVTTRERASQVYSQVGGSPLRRSVMLIFRGAFTLGTARLLFQGRASTRSDSKPSSTLHPADTNHKDARTRGGGGNIRCNRRASP